MAGNEKSPCGLRDIRQATGGLWESRERRRVRVAFMAKWVRLHPSEPLLWGNALHSFDFQLFRFLSCYFLFITQKHHTFVWRFCCASFSSTHFGGPGGIRTLDLSDANRMLSRTRHNASTEHLEGNGCVLFKTGTGCVLFDIFHRTVRTSAPILNKQELSINPSLRQPSEKYSANRRINFPPIIGKLLEYLTIRCILKKKRNRGSRNEGLQKTSC